MEVFSSEFDHKFGKDVLEWPQVAMAWMFHCIKIQ